MNTKNFHIIPKSLLKKMQIDEKIPIYYLDLKTNQIKEGKEKFYFSTENIWKGISKNKKDDLIKIMNLVEEVWNESNIENEILNSLKDFRKSTKKNNNKRLISLFVSSDDRKVKALWEKSMVAANLRDIGNNFSKDMNLFFMSINIIINYIQGGYLKLKTKLLKNNLNYLKNIEIFKVLEKFEEKRIKDGHNIENNRVKDSQNEEFITILFKHQQPLSEIPLSRVPIELIKKEYWHLVPYGYNIYQINNSFSLIKIDTLRCKGNAKVQYDEIMKLDDKMFNKFINYLYFNSFAKIEPRLFSNNKEDLIKFNESIKTNNYDDSILNNYSEFSKLYSNLFLVSPEFRDKNYYKPSEEFSQALFLSGDAQISNLVLLASKLRGPSTKTLYESFELLLLMYEKFKKNEISNEEIMRNSEKILKKTIEDLRYIFHDFLSTDEEIISVYFENSISKQL